MMLRVTVGLVIVSGGGLGALLLLPSSLIERRFFLNGFLEVAMDFERQVDNHNKGQDTPDNDRDQLQSANFFVLLHVPHHHIFDLS